MARLLHRLLRYCCQVNVQNKTQTCLDGAIEIPLSPAENQSRTDSLSSNPDWSLLPRKEITLTTFKYSYHRKEKKFTEKVSIVVIYNIYYRNPVTNIYGA